MRKYFCDACGAELEHGGSELLHAKLQLQDNRLVVVRIEAVAFDENSQSKLPADICEHCLIKAAASATSSGPYVPVRGCERPAEIIHG